MSGPVRLTLDRNGQLRPGWQFALAAQTQPAAARTYAAVAGKGTFDAVPEILSTVHRAPAADQLDVIEIIPTFEDDSGDWVQMIRVVRVGRRTFDAEVVDIPSIEVRNDR